MKWYKTPIVYRCSCGKITNSLINFLELQFVQIFRIVHESNFMKLYKLNGAKFKNLLD